MSLSAYAVKLLGLAETFHRWLEAMTGLDRANRERIAAYAEEIAATLARAALALERVCEQPSDGRARNRALTELGRITGYVETLVSVLEPHLDGRKTTGVKRRLLRLASERLAAALARRPADGLRNADVQKIRVAEGYFRALADGLRA